MRNALKVLFVVALAIPTLASATIINTKHNLSSTGTLGPHTSDTNVDLCKFCHLVHDASASGGTLWARKLPTGTGYSTPNATSDGTPLPATITNMTFDAGTIKCLSCHDGSVALNVVTSAVLGDITVAAGNSFSGGNTVLSGNNVFLAGTTKMANLNGQHPVAIPFPGSTVNGVASKGTVAEYATATVSGCIGNPLCVTGGAISAAGNYIKLYGGTTTTASVECGSCHEPHLENVSAANPFFLRVPTTLNGRCAACHKK